MSRPAARYRPSRRYLVFAICAAAGAAVSFWSGLQWSPEGWRAVSLLAGGGFAITASVLLALFARPPIEIHDTHLRIGPREIAWTAIRRVDHTGWLVPLVVRLTLDREERVYMIYGGDAEPCTRLLTDVRRRARHALLDGLAYRQFWGDPANGQRKQGRPARYPMLRPEDEEEVERLFQRLKSAGRLDRHAPDEKIGEK